MRAGGEDGGLAVQLHTGTWSNTEQAKKMLSCGACSVCPAIETQAARDTGGSGAFRCGKWDIRHDSSKANTRQ